MVKPIIVDVRVSENSDVLYINPRNPVLGPRLVKLLKKRLPSNSLPRRTVQGVRIPTAYGTEIIRGIPGIDARSDSGTARFLANRARANRAYPRLVDELNRIKDGGSEVARSLIPDSVGLGVLDHHQVVNVAAMTTPGGFGLCVFDEQGAGKTVTFIYAFDLLVSRDEVDAALIVAPKSMVPEWRNDFYRFLPGMYKVAVVSGSQQQKLRAIRGGADILIINFETAVSMECDLKAILRSQGRRYTLTIDESFFVKSISAKRTKALRRLREWCDRAFVLCGTPAPNAPHDLVQQFNLIDFGLAFDGTAIPEDRESAAPVIQRIIEERGLFVRHLKSEVLPDLPAKKFHRTYIPMEPIQRLIYEDALCSLVHDIETTTDEGFKRQLTNFAARRAALLQTCSNPAAVTDCYTETPAKLVMLDSLLRELIKKQHEKVVVWSFYTKSIAVICERYKEYGVLRYDGQVSDITARRDAVQSFQEDSDSNLFVANPAAAGAGLTLHRARFAIYESFSNQAAHYLQSLDRIHRRGQVRDVEYLILLCEGTVEVQEYDRLVSKEAAAQALLGDHTDSPLTRESFLSDLKAASNLLQYPDGNPAPRPERE